MVLSYDECYWAAEYVLEALDAIGEAWCCLVGGMAARLYGVDRLVKVASPVTLGCISLKWSRTWTL
jgi:hypothetical protein